MKFRFYRNNSVCFVKIKSNMTRAEKKNYLEY